MVNLFIILTFCLVFLCSGFNSGFWYGNTRPPITSYNSVLYANCSVLIDASFYDGPGQDLVTDPNNSSKYIFTGNTINRQSFDTQFVLDLQHALNISVDRIYVVSVQAGNVHFTHQTSKVVVQFIILERNHTHGFTLLDTIAELTQQIQNSTSLLYTGTNVTNYIDPLWGLQIVNWDMSLRLFYSIEVVGGDEVIDGYYLNQGGLGVCDRPSEAYLFPRYCEFERFFEDDVSRALNISYYRIQLLFVKAASMDSVLVFFRVLPPPRNGPPESNVMVAAALLLEQVQDTSSPLFAGNVTIKVDQLWGVSNIMSHRRTSTPIFTYKYYKYDPNRLNNKKLMTLMTPYDRCKANRRCNWGITGLNQSSNYADYYHQLFDEGSLFPVELFLDFEDWRFGTRGFSWSGEHPPVSTDTGIVSKVIPGAHFVPFDQRSLGPDIPCYLEERNQGLILDRSLQTAQVHKQEALVEDLNDRIEWMIENIEWGVISPAYRSRKDVKEIMWDSIVNYTNWWENEVSELISLNTSQCSVSACTIVFNTSSLELYGAINDVGEIKTTASGTEIAVFTFNSIYLGPETQVILTGQRGLALVSKTSVVINTTIAAVPGTIGGMQGGFSVGRLLEDALADDPRPVLMCNLGSYCNISAFNESDHVIISNNVNGIGSGNLKIHPVVITTAAPHIPEVQHVKSYAQNGQTLEGGFTLSFNGYTTTVIPHDASAEEFKSIIEKNLNIVQPQAGVGGYDRSTGQYRSGIGKVDVTRSLQDEQEGYVWAVTFSTYTGNPDPMVPTSYLQGLRANVVVTTFQEGNEVEGYFVLDFEGAKTRPISPRETADGLKQKLLELPSVAAAFVERIDPTGNCDDGLCENGPLLCAGMVWTVYIGSSPVYDNVSPTEPSSVLNSKSGPLNTLSAISYLEGVNASVSISWGYGKSPNGLYSLLNISGPFSFAFGGGGASYGGLGGRGYGEIPVGAQYNDETLTDLYGGSGGCMRSPQFFEINSFLGPSAGRGGHGGGAIEIVAANDVTIGNFGIIDMSGGDGEQTSEGGGGGGSGGAILISAGGVIANYGVLNVTGGAGGYGGISGMAGGGGGGGRIANYAESITNFDDGQVIVTGGPCGIYKTPVNESVVIVNASLLVQYYLPLDDNRLFHLGKAMVETALPEVKFVNLDFIDSYGLSNYIFSYIWMELTFDSLADVNALEVRLNATSGLEIGMVVFLESFFQSSTYTYITPIRALTPQCSNPGGDGTYYAKSRMTNVFSVRKTQGAEETASALYLSNNEYSTSVTGSQVDSMYAFNGPTIPFNRSQPTRVTYYVLMNSIAGESKKADFGTMFTLLSHDANGNVENIIGVHAGDKIMFSHNYIAEVDELAFLKRSKTIYEYPVFDRWYKVDIMINWALRMFSIKLDDTVVASNIGFTANYLDSLRISVHRSMSVWYDEIYVGFDNSMEFTCPTVSRQGTATVAPEQKSWDVNELSGGSLNTRYKRMQRHYNALEVKGAIPFDGQGQVLFNSDIKLKYVSGDYLPSQGKVFAGAIDYLKTDSRSWRSPSGRSASLVSPQGLWNSAPDGPAGAGDGRHFWFTEYSYNSTVSNTLNGGIALCSSQDLVSWRFEGIVFHYANLTDLAYGSQGPFYVERPKMLFNEATKSYVIWAAMDSNDRSLAMTSVVTSPYIDGPYMFRRSFYPDGNRTRDQIVFINDENRAILARTYYQTVEFTLPGAIMQPTWESVKFEDGTVNFGNNYHRAFYASGYDNFHDIYNQRWRKEDVGWHVQCVNRLTGVVRDLPYPEIGSDTGCIAPDERKVVIGQGNPAIVSKFIDPRDPNNSWWKPSSVPEVVAQPWSNNYVDGYCGIRSLNDDMDINDPDIEFYKPENRGSCSNIADNPTFPSLQDKLIGAETIIGERRAKFVAISELTPDYMDTTGVLITIEGELTSGQLITMISSMGQFGFGSGNTTQSTFLPPAKFEFETALDYKTRFRQYIRNYNDRSSYSLACVLDGVCPVNFKDELTEGQT